jgi:hypothetical protein
MLRKSRNRVGGAIDKGAVCEPQLWSAVPQNRGCQPEACRYRFAETDRRPASQKIYPNSAIALILIVAIELLPDHERCFKAKTRIRPSLPLLIDRSTSVVVILWSKLAKRSVTTATDRGLCAGAGRGAEDSGGPKIRESCCGWPLPFAWRLSGERRCGSFAMFAAIAAFRGCVDLPDGMPAPCGAVSM